MHIKKIGVGLDLSPESMIALDEAMVIARRTGATITTITAGDVFESGAEQHGPTAAAIEHYQSVLAERQKKVRAELEEVHERYDGQGVELSQTLVHGFADVVIPDAAAELGIDLLIVGTHGRTGLSRFFLGSVAERVVRLASCDVMVARGPSRDFKRVLVPTDFSDHAERAVNAAVAIAEPDATITLLHCTGVGGAKEEELPAHLAESVEAAVKAHAERLSEQLKQTELTVNTVVRAGTPAHEIRQLADDYDLICMGSHGRRGARRLILGSVAEVTVRHAPCSVYVAHLPDQLPDS